MCSCRIQCSWKCMLVPVWWEGGDGICSSTWPIHAAVTQCRIGGWNLPRTSNYVSSGALEITGNCARRHAPMGVASAFVPSAHPFVSVVGLLQVWSHHRQKCGPTTDTNGWVDGVGADMGGARRAYPCTQFPVNTANHTSLTVVGLRLNIYSGSNAAPIADQLIKVYTPSDNWTSSWPCLASLWQSTQEGSSRLLCWAVTLYQGTYNVMGNSGIGL